MNSFDLQPTFMSVGDFYLFCQHPESSVIHSFKKKKLKNSSQKAAASVAAPREEDTQCHHMLLRSVLELIVWQTSDFMFSSLV